MDDLPSLHALRCAEAALRHRSMSAAAAELCVTHGAISRQVALAEDALGARLFVRGRRPLAPTAEGAALAEAVAQALTVLRAGVATVRHRIGGPLVVSCEPSLTTLWLIPRLARLTRAAGVDVHVTQGGGAIDLDRAAVDLALRRDDIGPARGERTPLFDEWLGPVCAPALARRRAVTLLHTRTRRDAWTPFRAAYRVTGEQRFDHFATAIQAAIAGLGVAIGPLPMVRDALAEGRLVAPRGFVRGDRGYVALTRRPLADDPRLARAVAWLRAEGVRLARDAARWTPRDQRAA